MKKIISLALAAALALTVLAGCSGNEPTVSEKDPQELAQTYATAINENGGEMAEYNPAFTQAQEEDGTALMLEAMGLNPEDMVAFAISSSMMNVKAYGIAAVMPAADKEETVKEALEGFVERKQGEFEFYLADQYDVALAAKVETLADGTILMVMTENQDQVFDAISAAILAE